MGLTPYCEKNGLKKGSWTPEEDQKLFDFIKEHGHGSWRALPEKVGLLRCGKSCRLRWTNYLKPDIKRGKFSLTEEQTIIQLHALLGNRWSVIASQLPMRTDNEIKNHWNTHLKKTLVKMGIDPETHKLKTEATSGLLGGSGNGNFYVSHMVQWESARLEAEARLLRESKMSAKGLWPPRNEALSPTNSSSVKSCDLSSKPDKASCKALTAVELMNSLPNVDESPQRPATLTWPKAWNSPAIPNGHDSSCYSSPQTNGMDQGSPASNRASLEPLLQHRTQPANCPALQIRWLTRTNDVESANEMTSAALASDSFSSLRVKYSEHSYAPEVGDIFQNERAELDGSLDGGSFSSSQSFQDSMIAEVAAMLSSSHTSSAWLNNTSDDFFRMDVQKRDSNDVPILTSVTASSSLLGDLDFILQDISSSKGSPVSSVGVGEMSCELSGHMAQQSRESACGKIRQNSFSPTLTEEIPDHSSSMLKQSSN